MDKWQAPRMWEGGRCWMIGGGPSILEQFNVPKDVAKQVKNREVPMSTLSPYMEIIHNEHVIGINNAYKIGDWIDVVFFGDCSWYLRHKKNLAKYSALKVSCCPRFQNRPQDDPECIKFLAKDPNKKMGIHRDSTRVAWNQNSGAAAISMACHFGVKQIILLGFDMKLDPEDDESHWFGYHVEKYSGKYDRKGNPKGRQNVNKQPFNRHLRGFPRIKQDADELGVEIINASPDSKINTFKKCSVKELLNA